MCVLGGGRGIGNRGRGIGNRGTSGKPPPYNPATTFTTHHIHHPAITFSHHPASLSGLINVDFADVRTVMGNAGTALMGIGTGKGKTRAQDAAVAAISSPLLDFPIAKAKGIVFNIVGGDDLTLTEINAAAEVIYENVDQDANIIFGALVDKKVLPSVTPARAPARAYALPLPAAGRAARTHTRSYLTYSALVQMNSEISITVLATGFSLGVADLVGVSNEEPEVPRGDPLPPTMRRADPPRSPPPSKRQGSGGVPGFLRRYGGGHFGGILFRCALHARFLIRLHRKQVQQDLSEQAGRVRTSLVRKRRGVVRCGARPFRRVRKGTAERKIRGYMRDCLYRRTLRVNDLAKQISQRSHR